MAGEKSNNLDLWNSVEDIDPKFTKPITGKDYSGTSPNPTYLVKLATEKLGPAGQGFGWEVIADGFQPLGETTLHFCRIRFWWGADRANSFEAYGQTKASYPTKSGFYKVDEDAPKKSLTDAITKALSQLGFASGIFLGRWDDSKYVAEVNAEYRRAENDVDVDAAQKRADDIIAKMHGCTTLEELGGLWRALCQENRAIAEREDVTKAKDEAKAKLEAA